jgi:hypothetical protein
MIVVDELRTYPIERIGPAARRFGTRWCHLMNDGTREELHAFAAKLGMPRVAFQDHPTLWHYDLIPELREQAVRLGAQEVQILEWIEGDWLQKRMEQAQQE